MPQQYQAYAVTMKSYSEVPFEFFVNALFGYKPKNEDVELVKKGLCPSCKRPWRENHICLEEKNEETNTSVGKDKITILIDDGYQPKLHETGKRGRIGNITPPNFRKQGNAIYI